MSDERAMRLYDLLPAIYRDRDALQGLPLKALLSVIQETLNTLARDAAGLYDNWFIETCADWAVPYLADRLGLQPLPYPAFGYDLRRFVASTLRYRRRKGTPQGLVQLGQTLTGWPTLLVEYRKYVAAAQHLQARRPDLVVAVSLRDRAALARRDTPFDRLPRAVDLRRGAPGAVRFHPDYLGLFVWRQKVYRVVDSPASAGPSTVLWRFSPFGVDTPLCNPRPAPAVVTQEYEAPGPLLPMALAREIQGLTAQPSAPACYFGGDPVFSLQLVGSGGPQDVLPSEIFITDLADDGGGSWNTPVAAVWKTGVYKVAVDLRRGRIRLRQDLDKSAVRVSFGYLAGGAAGAGPLDRPLIAAGVQVITVGSRAPADRKTLADALLLVTEPQAVIEIRDNEIYTLPSAVTVAAGQSLTVRAASGKLPRIAPQPNAATLVIHGGGSLRLSGLVLPRCTLAVDLPTSEIVLEQCTLLDQLQQSAGAGRLSLLQCQALATLSWNGSLLVQDSALQGGPGSRVSTALGTVASFPPALSVGGRCDIARSTLLGDVNAALVGAITDSLIVGQIKVTRTAVGRVEHSAFFSGSQAPQQGSDTVQTPSLPELSFTSTTFGDPGYLQLRADCLPALRTGASDSGQLGVGNQLGQIQREANLRAGLEEYLPVGYRMNIYPVT